MVEIRPLELKDCLSVAQAHINYLRTPFKGYAGIQILKIRYEAIASQDGGIGFVAVDEGIFAGFVCGIWDAGAIRKLVRKKWLSLMFNGIMLGIESPSIAQVLLHRMITPHPTGSFKIEGYELRPIVVLPEHRGRGIADLLTQRVLEDAKQRGYKGIFLFTELDNLIAAKFYTKFGFKYEQDLKVEGYAHKLFRYHFPASDTL